MNTFYSNVENAYWANWGFGGIMSSIDQRNTYLTSLSEITQTTPFISQVNMNGTFVEAKVNNPTQVELMATISPYNSKFNSFTMYDDGLLGDAIANDGVYTAELPYLNSGQEIKFYIRSHNNNAISLSPQRAEYEFYTFHPNAELETVQEVNNIKVYPNPSNGMFNVYAENSSEIKCEVFNLYGQVILSKTENSNKTFIDLSNKPHGVYVIRVNGQSLKIIKE